MPSTQVVFNSDQSHINLAVTNPVLDFAMSGGTPQNTSATSPSSSSIQFGGTTQHDPVEEPSSIIAQSAPASPVKPSSMESFEDMRKAPDLQCPKSNLVSIVKQRPIMIPATLDLRGTDASVFPCKVFDLVAGYLQHKDLVNLSRSCRSCLQTLSKAPLKAVVVPETRSAQSHSSCIDKPLKVDLSAAATPVPHPIIDNMNVTAPLSVEPKKTSTEFTTALGISKTRKDVRRSSRPVPRITLPPVTRSRVLYIEGPERDPKELAIDDDEEEEVSSDDEDDDQQNNFSLTYHTRLNSHNGQFVSFDWDHMNDLLEFCPYSLTHSGRTCPLGEQCALKKVCHRNSSPVGCSKKSCPYSHDVLVSCRTFLKDRQCKHAACTYSHDYDLRAAVREMIDDHVKHRSFGVKS